MEKLKAAADIRSALAGQMAELLELQEAVRRDELSAVRRKHNWRKKNCPTWQAVRAESVVWAERKRPSSVNRLASPYSVDSTNGSAVPGRTREFKVERNRRNGRRFHA